MQNYKARHCLSSALRRTSCEGNEWNDLSLYTESLCIVSLWYHVLNLSVIYTYIFSDFKSRPGAQDAQVDSWVHAWAIECMHRPQWARNRFLYSQDAIFQANQCFIFRMVSLCIWTLHGHICTYGLTLPPSTFVWRSIWCLMLSRGKALFTLDSLGLTTKAAAQSLKDCCRFDGPNLHRCLWALQRASFLGVLYVLHPGKINIEPKKILVCRGFSCCKWGIFNVFSGSMLVSGGVHIYIWFQVLLICLFLLGLPMLVMSCDGYKVGQLDQGEMPLSEEWREILESH